MAPLPIHHVSTEAATTGVVRWLLASRAPVALRQRDSGTFVMPFPWQYKLASVIAALFAAGMLVAGYLGFQQENVGNALYWLIACCLGWAFSWNLFDVFGRTVGCSDADLMVKSAFGHEHRYPWSAVAAIRYGTHTGLFVFRMQGGRAIRISVYRSGLRTLCLMAERHLQHGPMGQAPLELYEKAKNPT